MWDCLHHCLIGIMIDKTIACADGVIRVFGPFWSRLCFCQFWTGIRDGF